MRRLNSSNSTPSIEGWLSTCSSLAQGVHFCSQYYYIILTAFPVGPVRRLEILFGPDPKLFSLVDTSNCICFQWYLSPEIPQVQKFQMQKFPPYREHPSRCLLFFVLTLLGNHPDVSISVSVCARVRTCARVRARVCACVSY